MPTKGLSKETKLEIQRSYKRYYNNCEHNTSELMCKLCFQKIHQEALKLGYEQARKNAKLLLSLMKKKDKK
jgi:hypothetical protein